MSNSLANSTSSRIGKGRMPANSAKTAGPGQEARVPTKTPDAVKTTALSDQHCSFLQESGHNASTPVINIPPDQTSKQQQQTPMQTSRWGKSNTSDTGPVFQVVTRGSRVPLGTSRTFNPPSHPSKTQPTAPRTRSLAPNRTSSFSSISSPAISLRNRAITSSSGSNGAASSAHSTGRSRVVRTLSIERPTPPAASNCRSVARVLSFEDPAGGPASPFNYSKSVTPVTVGAAVDAGDAASQVPTTSAGCCGPRSARAAVMTDGSMDAVEQNLQDITNNSSSDSTSWLSDGDNSACGLLELEQTSKPAAASVPIAPSALLGIHDQRSATAAAKVLLQQLLEAVAGVMKTAGADAACTVLAATCRSDILTVACTDINDRDVHLQHNNPVEQVPQLKADHLKILQVLRDKTAAMLEAGSAADDVRQAVLPALLLSVAGMAKDTGNRCSAPSDSDANAADAAAPPSAGTSSDAGNTVSPAAATAAAALASAVQVGMTAAKSVLLPDSGASQADAVALTAGPSMTSTATGKKSIAAETSGTGSTGRKRTWLRRTVGASILLLWSLVLLATGYVAAVAWTLIEGSTGVSAAGSDGMGVTSSGHGVDWLVEWSCNGGADSGIWDAGDLLLGRRLAC